VDKLSGRAMAVKLRDVRMQVSRFAADVDTYHVNPREKPRTQDRPVLAPIRSLSKMGVAFDSRFRRAGDVLSCAEAISPGHGSLRWLTRTTDLPVLRAQWRASSPPKWSLRSGRRGGVHW